MKKTKTDSNPPIVGLTLCETKHGNPGESRKLPANLLVRLEPASNLPDDSEIKWWAYPLRYTERSATNGWPKETEQWAEDVGVDLNAEDVAIQTAGPSVRYQPRIVYSLQNPGKSEWHLAVIAPDSGADVFTTPEEALEAGKEYCDESEPAKHGYSRLVIARITTEYYKPSIKEPTEKES